MNVCDGFTSASTRRRSLAWLGNELERVFPLARAFVRPAFDEPDDVTTLLHD
jgi:hypothetical protein